MNDKELLEKCLLTDEELAEVTDCSLEEITKWGSYERSMADAASIKAIPIIRKAERKRILAILQKEYPARDLAMLEGDER